MTQVLPRELKSNDVIRLSGSRRGLGRKVAVKQVEDRGESTVVFNLVITGDGTGTRKLGTAVGVVFLRSALPIDVIGQWEGDVAPENYGRFHPSNGRDRRFFRKSPMVQEDQEGEAQVATATKTGKKKGTSAKGKSTAKSNGDRTRATDEELDKLAARVVKLRDVDEKSWSDIEDIMDIGPGRLRQLYNRGGGEPAERGSSSNGKKSSSSSKSKTSAKGKKKSSSRRSDPS